MVDTHIAILQASSRNGTGQDMAGKLRVGYERSYTEESNASIPIKQTRRAL